LQSLDLLSNCIERAALFRCGVLIAYDYA
jgi:hypothetical protein